MTGEVITAKKCLLRLGSTYLSTNQNDKAINAFQQVIANPNNASIQAAQWYIALAYLQQKEVKKAKILLNPLAKSGNKTYPTKAKELSKQL